ncbi:hypothetical protein [Nocardia mangyaensis]|uniref:hypothetical protein n=1 Tax=Nocardia mangyaensis TaxID=2213200 RepID=UPI003B8378C9
MARSDEDDERSRGSRRDDVSSDGTDRDDGPAGGAGRDDRFDEAVGGAGRDDRSDGAVGGDDRFDAADRDDRSDGVAGRVDRAYGGSDRDDRAQGGSDRDDRSSGGSDRGFRSRGGSDRDEDSSGSRSGGFDRGDERRRGGEGARATGGRTSERRADRPEEPDLPEDVQASDLDPAVRRDLLSLDKNNAETVARHMVMAVELLDDDPRLALAHARAARQRAGRIAVVRETAGVVAYHAEEWAEALSELRTARRMSGGSGLLAVMADCERGLGRPERAIELGRSEEAQRLSGDEATELRIVVAGARMDLGQFDQAVVTLQTSDLDPARTGSAAARLFYAYADALVAAGRTDEGLQWFLNAAAADLDGETDAEDRATELTGDAQ